MNKHQKWDAHLIEMKTGIEKLEKWVEIKGQFRASYLAVKAIAAVIDYEIENFYFYTTYEHASFMSDKENTVTRKAHLGKEAVRPEDEWNGNKFGLNIGDKLPFTHTPVKMTRNGEGILVRENI